MQQPPQDPTNQSGQAWPAQGPTNQSGQAWPSSPYNQSDPSTSPPPPPGSTPIQYGSGPRTGEVVNDHTIPPYPSAPYNTPQFDGPLKPKRRNGMMIFVLILVALVVILGGTTFFALRRTNVPTVAVPTTTNPAATVAATTVPATPIPTPTPAPTGATSTSTPVSSPGATVQPAATMPTGTVNENLLLTCGGCNDPIRVTIATVQVDDANGRMIWNISLKDITGNPLHYAMSTFDLQANATQTQIAATFSQVSGDLTSSNPYSIQGIFAFVPTQNTTYTLTAVVYCSELGINITFDPIQITNL